MSEVIENKIKLTFESPIIIQQKATDDGAFKVLLDAGNIIAESIFKKGKLFICGNGDSAAAVQHKTAGYVLLQHAEDKLLHNGWLTLDK